MSYEFIRLEKEDHLTIITINRPKVMNSIHPPACQEMDDALNNFSEDPEAWVAIITAAGDQAFCAGNDLKWQAEHGGEAVRQGIASLKGGLGGLTRRFDCFKPVIAAINGLAMGGGFEIALACDIIVATEKAFFALPEPRFGLMAGAGGVHRLPRHIPYHLAMGMILTGHHLSAQEAKQVGLVNEVVPFDELMSTAKRWAAETLECSPLAVRASKEAVLKGLDLSLEEAIIEGFPGMITMRESEDFVEGPKAFAQKRKPQWKGR